MSDGTDDRDVSRIAARWQQHEDRLTTSYTFSTFGDAIRFMQAAVPIIDEMDHHPDWSNAHRRVHVTLTSHDVGRVTERDYRLARALDRLYDDANPG